MQLEDANSDRGRRTPGPRASRRCRLAVPALLALMMAGLPVHGEDPPLNDLCIDAVPVQQGQHGFSNIMADTDGPPDSACSTFGNDMTWNDVWFQYIADEDGVLVVSTCGLVDFDSRISIYSGSCTGGELIELTCNDDAPGCTSYSSTALLDCVSGSTYLIRIGSYLEGMTGSGAFELAVKPPCFEACSDASQVELEPCGMSTNDGCNSAAYSADSDMSLFHEQMSIDVPMCGTWFSDGSVRDTDWYVFEVPEPGAMVTTTLHSSDLVVGYLYLARVGCPLEVIDYQYGECPTTISERWLTAGLYRAIVAPGFESTADCSEGSGTSRYELLMQESEFEVPYPENDDCQDATPVGDGAHPFTNFYSTTDGPALAPPECSEFGQQIAADVWFEYQAPCTGMATATLCEAADFDTRMEVWSGGCEGIMVACNDDGSGCTGYTSSVEFAAVCGETYLLRIGGYQGARGQGILTIGCTGSCCPADFDGDGQVGGSDLATLLGGWNSSNPVLDLNGDGSADGADLAVLLGSWGPC